MTSVLVSLAMAAIPVHGTSLCPAPAEVAEQLRRMLPEAPADRAAFVEPARRGVRLELREPSGAVVASKILQGGGSCADLASASAVVILTWLSDLQAASLAAPEPEPAPAVEAPPPRSELGFDVAAGVSGSLSGGSLAFGALAVASLTPGRRGLGGQLAVAALGARDLRVGPGLVTWERFAAALGAHHRLVPGDWRVDLVAEALAGLIAINGDNFAPGVAETAFELGVSAGVRARPGAGLWFGLQGNGWLWPRTVTVEATSAKLPQFEVLLAGGVAWGND